MTGELYEVTFFLLILNSQVVYIAWRIYLSITAVITKEIIMPEDYSERDCSIQTCICQLLKLGYDVCLPVTTPMSYLVFLLNGEPRLCYIKTVNVYPKTGPCICIKPSDYIHRNPHLYGILAVWPARNLIWLVPAINTNKNTICLNSRDDWLLQHILIAQMPFGYTDDEKVNEQLKIEAEITKGATKEMAFYQQLLNS